MSSDSPTKETRPLVRLGKYEVVEHIATGGMGAVYRARDTELDREVALKVLTPEMAAKPVMLERFRREARNAAKLRHENIVTLYEFVETGGAFFLAMEFVDGFDLLEYIDHKGMLEPEESRQIILQAARALGQLYELGIVHRDIKPSNFLLTRKGRKLQVKLTDLGLARETAAEDFRVTRDGTTVGTVDYIAPEQARDSSAADTRSDLYSLGCTWYHMLTGQVPFPEGGLAERLVKHMEADPPDVRRVNPQVSRALWEVLQRLLAKKPQDRYETPRDLIEDLLSLDAVSKSNPDQKSLASPRKGRSRRSGSSRDTDLEASVPNGRRRRKRRKRDPSYRLIAGLGFAGLILIACLFIGRKIYRMYFGEQGHGESAPSLIDNNYKPRSLPPGSTSSPPKDKSPTPR